MSSIFVDIDAVMKTFKLCNKLMKNHSHLSATRQFRHKGKQRQKRVKSRPVSAKAEQVLI